MNYTMIDEIKEMLVDFQGKINRIRGEIRQELGK